MQADAGSLRYELRSEPADERIQIGAVRGEIDVSSAPQLREG